MLISRDELYNAGKLLGIRLRHSRRRRVGLLAGLAVLFFATMAVSLVDIAKPAHGLSWVTLMDFSWLVALAMVLAFAWMARVDRGTHQYYFMFPQTNTSRFLTNQAIAYIWLFEIMGLLLVGYVAQYGLLALLAGTRSDVLLGDQFNLGFVCAGFGVTFVLLAMIAATINFLGVLLRKYGMYAVLGIAILAALVVRACFFNHSSYYYGVYLLGYWNKVLGFLVFEKNPGVFVLKGMVCWLVLFGLSFVINRLTVSYPNPRVISYKTIVVIVLMGVIAVAANPLPLVQGPVDDGPWGNSPIHEIVLDSSHIAEGSQINIITTNIVLATSSDKYQNTYLFDGNDFSMPLSLNEETRQRLAEYTGQRIIVTFRLPTYWVQGIECMQFLNQHLSAQLEGNSLYLDYQYTHNAKIVIMPVWFCMKTFDGYMKKGEYKGDWWSEDKGDIDLILE